MKPIIFFSLISFSIAGEDKPQFGKIYESVWLEIEVDGYPRGKIHFGLFRDIVPRTAKNFKKLALSDSYPSYKGTIFHRVSNWMIQGGDVEYKDGVGGVSIYGKTFDDENFDIGHYRRGYVAMSNSGPNSNASQFYIVTKRSTHLDGEFVVFAKITEGWEIVEKLQQEPVNDEDDYPLKKIKVVGAGVKRLLNPLVVNFQEDFMEAMKEDKPEEKDELPEGTVTEDELRKLEL